MTTPPGPPEQPWQPWQSAPTAPLPQQEPPAPMPSMAPAGSSPDSAGEPSWARLRAPNQPAQTWSENTAPPATSIDAMPAPAPPSSRRGPGWSALVGVALVSALLAGTTGGIIGSFVSSRADSASSVSAPKPGPGATERPAGTIAAIAATATPSVVTLEVEGSNGGATGSGWVYDGTGHIVTNNHVVADAAGSDGITVVLADGSHRPATVVGRDASYDLAVVKVDPSGLNPLPVGASDAVVVGDEVIAVGAPLGLESTVTAGIISALNRPVTPGGDRDQSFINAIQTDAAINPGNSGGPLLNMSGEVIGVNSAIAQVASGGAGAQVGSIGVGFAIPSDQVVITVDQLIATGKADHPIIGVFLDTQYSGEGVRIADSGPGGEPAVAPRGPADRAGLRAGDIIVAFEGSPVTDNGELVVRIRSQRVGDEVTLTVRRDGSDRDVTMVLEGSSS